MLSERVTIFYRTMALWRRGLSISSFGAREALSFLRYEGSNRLSRCIMVAAIENASSLSSSSSSPADSCPESHHALLNMVHQGQYECVLDVWEREKRLQRMNSSLYTVVMAMCEHLKSAELAVAVQKDMKDHHFLMEPACCVHFVRAHLADGQVEEAMEFVKTMCTSNMKNVDSFLLKCSVAFREFGHVEEAVELCELCPHSDNKVKLDVIKMECLGAMEDVSTLSAFIAECYGSISHCPKEIQLAMVHGYAMAGELKEALHIFKLTSQQQNGGAEIGARTLALLLECAVRNHDFREGISLCCDHLEECAKLESDTFKEPSTSRSTFLLRAANAAISLQALVHRNKTAEEEAEQAAKEFLQRDFYQFILDESLVPNSSTLESVFLLLCFDGRVREVVEKVTRVLVRNGEKPSPRSFTKWTRHCGQIPAPAARKVIQQVRMLVHGYNIPLTLRECSDLLSLQYPLDDDEQKMDAVRNIRVVKRIMKNNDLLSDVASWNHLLSAYLRTTLLKTLYTTLEDMAELHIRPNLDTHRIITEGLCAMDDYQTYILAIYDFWREFAKDYPSLQPDMEYLNKLIFACRRCRHMERAFYFLTVVEQCDLNPDLCTFRELLLMCSECDDREKFGAVLKMAQKCLPEHKASLDAIVSDCELEWKAKVDAKLASRIISGSMRVTEEKHTTREHHKRQETS